MHADETDTPTTTTGNGAARQDGSNWVNAGTYRNQVLGPDRLGVYISPGKHGNIARRGHLLDPVDRRT